MTISVAFPYAQGRRQEPLSERILTNDLYGIPLYQPPVGLIGPGQTTGAKAAAAVIRNTGTDPELRHRSGRREDQKNPMVRDGLQTRCRPRPDALCVLRRRLPGLQDCPFLFHH